MQILHTNTDTYGHLSPLGHVDYYLNGGKFQDNCSDNIFACSHLKAYNFLIDVYQSGLKCQSKANYYYFTESNRNASRKSPAD